MFQPFAATIRFVRSSNRKPFFIVFRAGSNPRRDFRENPRVVLFYGRRHEEQVREPLRRHARHRERLLGPAQRTGLALVDHRDSASRSSSPSKLYWYCWEYSDLATLVHA